jgi:hypothetical protein
MLKPKNVFVILTTIAALFLSETTLFAQATTSSEILEEKLKTEEISLNMLAQSLARFSFRDDDFQGGRTFELGSARIGLRGTLDSRFTYRIQTELTNTPSILDLQVGYIFSDEFRIIAGQMKPFFTADLRVDPGLTDMINRVRLVRAMVRTREVGVAAVGESGNMKYRFAVYNGNGRAATNSDNKFLYMFQFGYDHEEDDGDGTWEFAVNAALNSTENETVGNTGQISAGDRLMYGGYVDYDSDTFFGTAEFLQSKFDLAGSGLEQTINGMYVTLGNKVTEKDELLVRWERIALDLNDANTDWFILGWNHYPAEFLQIQVNLTGRFQEGEDQYGASANFQFRF